MKTSRNTNPNSKKIFPKYMQEKLAITVLVITLALFALVMVLYNLTKTKQEDFNQIILANQNYSSRVLPFKRGDIMDRNGTYLAVSDKVYNLILDPRQIMTEPDRYLEPSVAALTDCFGYDRAEIMGVIQEKKDSPYVRYARQLTYEQKENFEAYKKAKEEEFDKAGSRQAINGIWFEDEYKRVYPYNSLACNVVGFANGDGLGGTGGIEQYYNDVLMGTNGREYGYLNDESNLERVIKPAVNGYSIVSTIDANVQKIVEKYINKWMAETGSKNIGVVVMDPDNGEVLAMSSDRQFDLNNPRELGSQYTDTVLLDLGKKEAVDDYRRKHKDGPRITEAQVYEHYTTEEVLSLGKQVAWNQTWRNYCVSDTFEPGSTSKIFTVAAALEEGSIAGAESYDCTGFLHVGDYDISCVNVYGHGPLTVQEGLMKSCNVVMMRIAQSIGKARFYKYQQMFGFGSRTGIDLPGEADTKTVVYKEESAGPTDLATNSFGQNFNCTMVQMAAAYCSVINGGSYYEPHVVKQILNEQGSVVERKEPKLVRETVSESTSKYINEALWRTVNEEAGTGKIGRIDGYDVAGKTGTAEKIPRDHTNYVVSFAGYAPAYDPQILVYVVIDEPHVESQPHSSYATGVFKEIMEEILPYLNIFPSTEPEQLPEEIQGQLPESEGITETTAGETQEAGEGETTGQEETQETTAGPEEQYVETPEGGENLPELPASVPGLSREENGEPPGTAGGSPSGEESLPSSASEAAGSSP